MQSYVNNAMKIAEKVGLAGKKGAQENPMESAKETLTLSGTLSDPHRAPQNPVSHKDKYQRDQMK